MQPIDRRTFIADLGRGAFALAVVSLAACSPGAQASARPTALSAGSQSPLPGSPAPGETSRAGSPPGAVPPARDELTWQRVNLGFVSAYVLVRGGQAAIVDTGVGGSAGSIEQALAGIGLEWSAVGDVILTHKHNDHVGSLGEVMEAAADATGYAGGEDIPSISAPRPISEVGDGDTVFGLKIVTTPGHTPGSISVHDATNGILVAGDALQVEGGKPALPGARFTEDMDEARRSVAKLGELTFETLLVGHGEPIEGGAGAAVAELAAQG
ncbi:MAG TPA: MBL fold metallo-hydrolase [Candidatus Limnocylindrales bacterium]|nr:MBL fold metallo-hydrolase [Candidatus Limnocylindrales bacterium]